MKFSLLSAAALLLLFGAGEAQAWCLWGAVKGTRLAYIGNGHGVPHGATTAKGRTNLNTQGDQKALFFGYVGNEIKIFRDGRKVAHCGNYKLEPKHGGGYTTRNAIDGSVTYQPGWLLLQSPLVTRIYACQPHGLGHFRMAGGQGARWSTGKVPVVNEVRAYESTWVDWEATGYGVLVGGNQNFVSLIEMDDLWPCEMIADFATPAAALAMRSDDDYKHVRVRWSGEWPCNYSAGDSPIEETGLLFTVRGESVPPQGGSISGVGRHHTGKTAQIFARANEGFEFDRWEGGYSSNPAAFGVLVDGDISLVARFKAKMIPITLTVRAAGSANNKAWAEGAIFANGREMGRRRVSSGRGQGPASEVLKVMVPYNAKVWFDGKGGAESVAGDGPEEDKPAPIYEASGGGKSSSGEGSANETRLGEATAKEPVNMGSWSVRAGN
jgi:hypothetical protein